MKSDEQGIFSCDCRDWQEINKEIYEDEDLNCIFGKDECDGCNRCD